MLERSIDTIKGVGPKSAQQFREAGIETIEDLINFFPRIYEDFSRVQSIRDIRPGRVSVRGRFENISSKRVRRNMTVVEATLFDDTGKVQVVWFNQAYRVAQLKTEKEFLVSGEFNLQRNHYQIVSPSAEMTDGEGVNGGRIVPIYPATRGLKSVLVRKTLNELKPLILSLPETLPIDIVKEEKLMGHADALYQLHFPDDSVALERARERLGFEEILSLVLASLKNREDNDALASHMIEFSAADARAFVKNLPFDLTNAQRLAAWEAIQNLSADKPMNRMLQGDVGSGKTVVAGLVAYIAARNGYQSAIMAPTELLARQHAETLSRLLEPFEVSVALLTGSVKNKSRRELFTHIADGSVSVVIGTHALIEDPVKFHKLGFVVIDEQHRFGVAQRQKLLTKSDKMPHLLAMTATPIPRSLQLTVYGELDISILGEKPKNRLPITTEIISPNSRAQMYEKVEKEIQAGRQVYVVCPLIEASSSKYQESRGNTEDAEIKSVKAEYVRLQNSIFKHRRIGLLHGKLKPDEKQEVMERFASGDIDILVSTTVVEVGVDVPNATVIIIEAADTFGLAQLHQLRGRVGRSELQSYCYLVPSTSKAPSLRLRELEKSNDGFYLAERDLELRGPGEIYGRAQHGALDLKIANINDLRLLKKVRRVAPRFVEGYLDLKEYKKLADEVERYRRLTALN